MKAFAGAFLASFLATAATAQIPYTSVAVAPPGLSACPGGLCQAEALTGLFTALSRAEFGLDTAPVHILQIGDSHTAGDRITGKLRAALQARFGDGGRGVLPPGVPWDGYAPLQVEVAAEGWTTTLAPLVGNTGYVRAGVGLTGVQAITVQPGSTLSIRRDAAPDAFQRIGLCGEGPGRLEVSADAETWTVDFGEERCAVLFSDAAPRQVRLRALDGVLKLHDVRLTNIAPGVEVSNLGVVGATLRDLAARDQAVVARELAAWEPALIILAFGTNEGFDDGLDGRAYEALLRGQILRLRRLAPQASLMILGAPDALRNGVLNGCSADDRRNPPPSLAVVRDVQRRVAADTGVAFWDWHGRMGGDCSADRLATGHEPLMRGDRVHFTSTGADWIGGVLTADLLAAYEVWGAQPAMTADTPVEGLD